MNFSGGSIFLGARLKSVRNGFNSLILPLKVQSGLYCILSYYSRTAPCLLMPVGFISQCLCSCLIKHKGISLDRCLHAGILVTTGSNSCFRTWVTSSVVHTGIWCRADRFCVRNTVLLLVSRFDVRADVIAVVEDGGRRLLQANPESLRPARRQSSGAHPQIRGGVAQWYC